MSYSYTSAPLRTQQGFVWVLGAVFIGALIALGVFANTTRAEDPAEEPQRDQTQEVLPPQEETPSDEGIAQDEGATTSDDGDGENDGEDEEDGEESDGQVEGAAFGALFFNPPQENHNNSKVDICHWDNGQGGKWASNNVSWDSIIGNGNKHGNHQKDIIPAFDYWFHGQHGWVLLHYNGKNLENGGQAFLDNGCKETGSITIVKQVVGAGDQEVPPTWSFDFSGDWNFSLTNEDSSITEENLQSGSYTITESDPDDDSWTLVGIECSEGGNGDGNTAYVTLDGDEDVTCTFTNEYRKPEEPKNSVTLHAQKIVCDDESDLPNWGAGTSTLNGVTSNTATRWLNANAGNGCHLADWEFQWVDNALDSSNPGDQTGIAPAPWSTPFTGSVAVDASNINRIWLREVFDDDYIPFTGANTNQDVSAELYCGPDILNYDNWEFIDKPENGWADDYYCVAFNVLKEAEACRVEVVSEAGDAGVGNGPAVLAWIHANWTTALNPFAFWIWDTNLVQNPSIDESKTFTKNFYVDGPVNDATLEFAADNRYSIEINGDVVAAENDEHNYESTQTLGVTGDVDPGWNTIQLTVENIGVNGSSAQSNPAAGIYRLVVNGDAQNECKEPPVEDETTDVTICKYDDSGHLLPGWTVMLLGEHVEGVNVPSDGTEVFSSALTNGDPYAFIANGTYTYRPGYSGDISDPGFTKRTPGNDPIDPTTSPFNPWVDVNDLPSGVEGYLGIAVDGDVAGTNWSDIYNSLHTYALGYTGTGAAAGFKIWDDVYGDNSGSLDVDIYEGYVGTTGENGCVTFEDVPNGGYVLDEILQDGWENIDGKGEEVEVNEESHTFYLINSEDDAPICDPKVNLIQNGGFESPDVSVGAYAIFYSPTTLLEWLTGENGIEIQDNIAGSPFNGDQFAELDPNHPTTIWQSIETIPGATYRLETQYSPRPGRDAADNEFEFIVDGSAVGPSIARDGVGNTDTDWGLEYRTFVAADDSTDVGFREIGTDSSYGAYLDDVALYCDPNPKDECLIEGYKYDYESNGGLNGWTIGLIKFPVHEIASLVEQDEDINLPPNGILVGTDVTDFDDKQNPGYYCIPGEEEDGYTYRAFEMMQGGWDDVGYTFDGGSLEDLFPPYDGADEDMRLTDTYYDITGTQVDFYNSEDDGGGEQCIDEEHGWTDTMVDTEQGTLKNGSPITNPDRTDPNKALGAADWVPNTGTNFYSLGKDGWITLSFDKFVPDVDGDDLSIHEGTNGQYPEEKAKVEVSQDGDTWYTLTEEASNLNPGNVSYLDFSETGLAWIKFVRITDTTNYALHANDADGFDLDAVDATQELCDEPKDDNGGNGSSITIDKVVLGENANANLPFDFNLNWLNQDIDLSLSANDEPETYSGLGSGNYTIAEITNGEDAWYLTDISCDGGEYAVNFENGSVTVYAGENANVTCTFTNTYRPEGETPNDEDTPDTTSGGGGGGTSFRRSGGSSGGQVLGASTDNPFCPFLRDYQHISFNNDPSEVNKAKAFFNSYMGKNLALDGVFDQAMFDAVVEFQSMFKSDVLDTWVSKFGFLDDEPTGYLYQTTRWKINSIMCPGYEAFPDQLIIDSHGTSVASAY